MHTAPGEPVTLAGAAGYRLADLDLAGYVALDFEAFDWREEDEPVAGTRATRSTASTSAAPRGRCGSSSTASLVAESSRARLVFETGLPTRFYVPREDVRVPLRPSELRTYCPYKGEASYFSFDGGEDLLWCYEQPLPRHAAARRAAGLLARALRRRSRRRAAREPREDEIVEVMLDEFGV